MRKTKKVKVDNSRFKIIKSLNIDIFQQEINDYLSKGWTLHGDILHIDEGFVQAITF